MKKVLNYTVCALLVLVVLLSAILIFKREKTDEYEAVVPTVIEVWQIDGFEGGQGSRTTFLGKVATEFETENDNVIVKVTAETFFSAEEKFRSGIYPDVVSYSNGLDGIGEVCEINFTGKTFGGSYDGKTYAVPWAYGGYVYITHDDKTPSKVYVSKCDYTQPLIAMTLAGLPLDNFEEKKPQDAYYSFLADGSSALFGTQRDLFRLTKKGVTFSAKGIGEFTDLVQYVSVFDIGERRFGLAKEFIVFLEKYASENVQSLGLMSPSNSAKIADNSVIAPLIDANYTKTLSVFYTKNALVELNAFLSDEKKNYEEKLKYAKNAVNHLK